MNAIIEKRTVTVQPGGGISLQGNLNIPETSRALVIFSHGSGSSRFSPRNNFVAERLNRAQMATLLIDLLTEGEDGDYQNRFDIDLLTLRLIQVTAQIHEMPELAELPIGYFGASTGAASALKAAADGGKVISAVVSRGGRPDLAMSSLSRLKAPVLLIVGSLDTEVLSLNRDAYSKMNTIKRMEIVNGASHLFEEPGKLEAVTELSVDWFDGYLVYQFDTNKHDVR